MQTLIWNWWKPWAKLALPPPPPPKKKKIIKNPHYQGISIFSIWITHPFLLVAATCSSLWSPGITGIRVWIINFIKFLTLVWKDSCFNKNFSTYIIFFFKLNLPTPNCGPFLTPGVIVQSWKFYIPSQYQLVATLILLLLGSIV